MQTTDKVISSFLFAKEIQGLSPNTIRNYRLTLSRFVRYFGAEIPDLADITPHEIRSGGDLTHPQHFSADKMPVFFNLAVVKETISEIFVAARSSSQRK